MALGPPPQPPPSEAMATLLLLAVVPILDTFFPVSSDEEKWQKDLHFFSAPYTYTDRATDKRKKSCTETTLRPLRAAKRIIEHASFPLCSAYKAAMWRRGERGGRIRHAGGGQVGGGGGGVYSWAATTVRHKIKCTWIGAKERFAL